MVCITCTWGTLLFLRQPKGRSTSSISTPASSLQSSQVQTGPLKGFGHLTELSVDPCQNIYKMVCQNIGETKDPTGSVIPDSDGQKQAMHLYEELIHDHQDWSSEQVYEELVKKIFDHKHRARLESAYHWVRHSIEKFFDSQPNQIFTPQEKHQIQSRLRRTKLELPPPASLYADEPDLITKNEAYYERTLDGETRLRVGGAFVFISKSWFNIIFTMAHELAHSIDPCEIRSIRWSFPAYDRLTACFLMTGLIATRKTRSECGANDQLSETFADWVAVQVTAEALALFSTEFHGPQIMNAARNSVRDLCEQEDDTHELDLEFHPSPHVRIEKIFGLNPKIRHLLGCRVPSTPLSYCTFDTHRPHLVNWSKP